MSEINLDFPERLVTPRLVIRRYQPGDGSKLFEAVEASQEHLKPHHIWGHQKKTVEDLEIFARTAHASWIAPRTDLIMGIWDPGETRLFGSTGLRRIDWRMRIFEIAYWIRPEEERKGLVTETVRELCRFAFEELAANRVHIRCAANNTRSAAVPRRLGFVEEGRMLNGGMGPDGVLHDTLSFGLTPELWNSLAPS
jgi:ribosomal-protein-serine acetyltransferase